MAFLWAIVKLNIILISLDNIYSSFPYSSIVKSLNRFSLLKKKIRNKKILFRCVCQRAPGGVRCFLVCLRIRVNVSGIRRSWRNQRGHGRFAVDELPWWTSWLWFSVILCCWSCCVLCWGHRNQWIRSAIESENLLYQIFNPNPVRTCHCWKIWWRF